VTRRHMIAGLIVATSTFVVTLTMAAQDRCALKVPNGLAFTNPSG
jgi:hypothetical protein